MEIYLILILLGFALSIAGLWRVFEKAGYKGYFTLIPIWNLWIWIKIIDKPKYWLLYVLIPFLNGSYCWFFSFYSCRNNHF